MKTVFGAESNVTSVNSQISLLNSDDFSPDVKSEQDCFQDLWQEMCIASECSKVVNLDSVARTLPYMLCIWCLVDMLIYMVQDSKRPVSLIRWLHFI